MAVVETVRNGQVLIVRMNRPESLNALNTELRQKLAETWTEFRASKELEVAIFTGAGRAFCAGEDMKESLAANKPGGVKPTIADPFMDGSLEKPVIAAINGPCTGAGLQITLSCDLRVASDQARFGFRENNIGLIPGAGGCSRLVKLIGYGRAKELIFTGEMIAASEAERIGLINRVVPHDELMAHTRQLAEHLLTRAPEALGLAKRLLWHSVTSDFATGRMLEALAQSVLIKSSDHREGVRAFREKRKPQFKGE